MKKTYKIKNTKTISYKIKDDTVQVSIYMDSFATRMMFNGPKSSSMSFKPNDWGQTPNSFASNVKAYCDGQLAQNAFPIAPAEVREFFISGLTPEEQKEIFK